MISGKPMTNSEYRKMDRLSASDLRLFITDKKKFFKKHIEKADEDEDEEYNRSFLIGDIVHCKLLEPDEFDNKFFMSICSEPPTGLMLKFTEALVKYTRIYTDEEGVVTVNFEEIAKEAYKEAGFKWTFPIVLEKFKGSNAETYYQELRESRVNGKKVVTLSDINIADAVVNTLKTHEFTRSIVNEVSTEDVIILHETQLLFEYGGFELKSMLDKIRIDKKAKTVQIYDYKVVWDNQRFYREYYLYRRADIQGFLYWRAAIQALKADFDLGDYEFLPPIFIVADSTNFYAPILFKMSMDDLHNSEFGWTDENNGRVYKGVNEILEELMWHNENGSWGETPKLREQNGIVPINYIF